MLEYSPLSSNRRALPLWKPQPALRSMDLALWTPSIEFFHGPAGIVGILGGF